MLVTSPANVRWLTGFTGSNGRVLVTSSSMLLLTDGRYEVQAADELARHGIDADLCITRTPHVELSGRMGMIETLALEAKHLSWLDAMDLDERLTSTRIVPLTESIDELRGPKDRGERARLAMAAGIADSAFASTVDRLLSPVALSRQPITERAFARLLEEAMFEQGADALSFETIVASGPNSARPHARPSDRIIEPGDFVVLDFGAAIEGYGSDMTRTVMAGGAPSHEQSAWYDAVADAQRAGVATVAADVEALAVDEACREVLRSEGMEGFLNHGTGHGIGLEIHEQPILSATSVGILRADLVVTVEPGAYREGFGGVRVEDSVIVTSSGCEPITLSPKGLVPA